MANDFWHSLVTDKSFHALQELRKNFDFVLIGGWAVYFYSKALKSKDIDIIVDGETLSKLKTRFDVVKNGRLKKYEIKMEGFDIDIYLPFWSALGLPLDFVMQNAVPREGFRVPPKEIMLILKLITYRERKGSLKGKKDGLDVISLLKSGIDFADFTVLIKKHRLEMIFAELQSLLHSMIEVRELDLNRKQYADFKKNVLAEYHRSMKR